MTVTYEEFINWLYEHEDKLGSRTIGRADAIIEGSFYTARGYVAVSPGLTAEEMQYISTDEIPETPEVLALRIAEVCDYWEHSFREAGRHEEADQSRDDAAALRNVVRQGVE